MRVLVDTNVVLDVLLKREPWVTEAAAVWRLCSEAAITGYVSASSFTDIYYVARRHTDRERARTALRLCLDTFAVCPIDQSTLERAYSLPGDDFEDNLQDTGAGTGAGT
jgi:predicted nucleic acid-binding protein